MNYPPVNRNFFTGSRNFPTANRKFSTVSRKFPTGCTKSPTADMGMKGKAIKPSACWSWKPSQNLSNKEFSSSKPQDHYSTEVPEGSGNTNPTASTSNPPADHMKTLTVESPIPTVSSPVPTAYSTDSQDSSSERRLILKRVTNQEETPSLDNILTLSNRFEDILGATTNSNESNGVEADVSNLETSITAKPKKIFDAFQDLSLVKAMQEELLQFKIQKVWSLVDCPKGVRPIGTKWALKNKKDERGIVIRNKARLVAQGHTQEDGIDYDEMNVKSAFLYGTIDEEVYVMQPPGFQDPEYPAKVYKVEKAMYGLHQAPRAWYGTLSKYLLNNGFQRGTIDQTLFIRRQRGDFILVQVYMDDIIFGSSNPQLCREFEALMHEKFQMSAMGELNFFLGLQVLQKEDGIFLSQDKYVGDILKKFGYSDVRSSNTPMDKENPWGKDGTGKDVDLHFYRSMIGSLMYLTASRPDIMFAVYAYARHQVTPKECHLHAVKRIFRYLKGHPKLGLWYPKDSPFDLVAYSDSDYGGATQDCKSTTEGDCFEKKLINVDHIYTDENVADLLAKPFDAGRIQYLV
nr:putative ribonuclease H-like domain-containing protein [Tanacetum cinerariifolium]